MLLHTDGAVAKWSLLVSALALGVSIATFLWARYEGWSQARSSRVKALQGDKAAVAYVAFQIQRGAWDEYLYSPRERAKIIEALCLAFAMEGADRAKALVASALAKLCQDGLKDEVVPLVFELHAKLRDYDKNYQPTDFAKRVKALKKLHDQLSSI